MDNKKPVTNNPKDLRQILISSSRVNELLNSLDNRSRVIIMHRYCLGGKPFETYATIGRFLGVTGCRVSVIEHKAIRKMRWQLIKPDSLELSVRALNSLTNYLGKQVGRLTDSHLVGINLDRLSDYKNCGKETINEIRGYLKENNISFVEKNQMCLSCKSIVREKLEI